MGSINIELQSGNRPTDGIFLTPNTPLKLLQTLQFTIYSESSMTNWHLNKFAIMPKKMNLFRWMIITSISHCRPISLEHHSDVHNVKVLHEQFQFLKNFLVRLGGGTLRWSNLKFKDFTLTHPHLTSGEHLEGKQRIFTTIFSHSVLSITGSLLCGD